MILFCAVLAPAQSIQDFFRQAFEERLRDEPEFATSVGHHEYDDRWNDWSKAGRDQRRAHIERRQQSLNSFSLPSLSPQDRLSARLMQFVVRTDLEAFDLEDELLRVSQQNGLHNRVYTTFDRMPALTVKDYENMLARLRAIPVYIDQNIALLDDAVARGMTQPRVVVDLVSAQLAAQIAQDKDHTALLAAFGHFPVGIPEAERTRLRAAGVAAYEQQFLPAWRKYRDYITGKYARAARPAVAISSIPQGPRRLRHPGAPLHHHQFDA